MGLCDRIQVLNYGVLIAEGAPGVVRNDPAVIDGVPRPRSAAVGMA